MTECVLIEMQPRRLAPDQVIILQLHAGEPLTIHSRHPNHRCGQVALRVETFVFVHHAHASEAKLLDCACARRRQMTCKPYEWGSVAEPRFNFSETHTQHRRESRSITDRSCCKQDFGTRIYRSRLRRERECLAIAINDRPANRS